MTNTTNIKQRKIYLHIGATLALKLAIAPGCKKKDDVGSTAASSTELPELRVVPAEVDKITVTNGSRLETKFEKRDGSWTIASPPPAGAANAEAVQAMLQNLSETKIKELFSVSASPEQLALYELTADKAMHIVVERGGTTVADLSFGKASGRGQMVRVGTNKGIWAASGYSSYLYSRELNQWRGAASSHQNSATGKPAGEVLKEHAELVDWVPDTVLRRAAAYASGDQGAETCPALEKITSSDEFERREAVAKATATCKPENDRVLEFLKTCPVFAGVHVNVSAYNFEKHMYSLSAKNNMAAQITQPGHALIRNKALVLWPGVQRMFERGSGGVAMDTLCKTRGPINDTVAAVTGIGIDLPMSEADAKTFRDKMKIAKEDDPNAGANEGVIEVALQLDGKATREELACGVSSSNALTGQVLAWRVVAGHNPATPLTEWTSVGNIEYSPSCGVAREVFYPKPGGVKPWTNDGGGNNELCVCDLVTPLRQFSDWADPVSDLVPDSSNLSGLRDRVARAMSRFENDLFIPSDQRSGCKADRGAKAKMMPFIARSRQSLKTLGDLLEKPEPDVVKVKAALKSLGSLYTSLVSGPLLCNDEGIRSGQCHFGCR